MKLYGACRVQEKCTCGLCALIAIPSEESKPGRKPKVATPYAQILAQNECQYCKDAQMLGYGKFCPDHV